MAKPPRRQFDDQQACCYHLASRCVRGALLCGRDEYTQRDYSHRSAWLTDRLATLKDCFAIVVLGHAVSNRHFHVVVYYDPRACIWWDDEEVARRWINVFPPTNGRLASLQTVYPRELLLARPERLERARRSLGSLSEFMRYLRIAARSRRSEYAVNMMFYRHFLEHRSQEGPLPRVVLTTILQLFCVPFIPGDSWSFERPSAASTAQARHWSRSPRQS